MITKSKLAIIAAIAAVSIASPALAQSLNPRDGTGNVLPFSYGPDSTRLFAGSPAAQPAQSGLHSFAQVQQGQRRLFAMVPRHQSVLHSQRAARGELH